MRSGPATTIIILLLLTPVVGASWNLPRGGSDGAGIVELIDGPLDVVSVIQLDSPNAPIFNNQFPVVLGSRQGLLGLDIDDDGCRLVVVPDPREAQHRLVGDGARCVGKGILVGYLPDTDEALVCLDREPSNDVLEAWNVTTGAKSWGIQPDLDVVVPDPIGMPNDLEEQLDWSCTGIVLDAENDRLVVPFRDAQGHHRLQAHRLSDQELLWSTTISDNEFGNIDDDLVPAPDSEQRGRFKPQMIVSNSAGLVVGGYLGNRRIDAGLVQTSAINSFSEPAMAWLTHDGQFAGASTAARHCTDPVARPSLPRSLAGTATSVAGTLCDTLLIIDPVNAEPDEWTIPDFTVDENDRAPLAWSRTTLAVPTSEAVHLFKTPEPTTPYATWQTPGGLNIVDIVLEESSMYVLGNRLVVDGWTPEVLQVDLGRAVTLQRLPLPGAEPTPMEDLRFTTWNDGLVVWEPAGQLVTLHEADGSLKPTLEVSNTYPGVGEVVNIDIAPGPDAPNEVIVGWGDGLIETYLPGDELSRSYDAAGDTKLHVTLVYDDGLTGTAQQVLHVGQTPPIPPPDLNFIQQAFDPENYDLTFGVLGILIALFGGLFALYRHQRGRSRIARELQALEKAYGATKNDPIACETALAERKARARGLFADGKLNETQFAVLDRRIDELGSQHRMEAIEDRFAFLSVGMARTLREMLADGRISDWERDHFIEALEQDEYLNKKQKAQVHKQVEAWFGRDAGVET